MKFLPWCLSASLLLVGGCFPTFDNPIVPAPHERVALAPYLGVWKLTQIMGSENKPQKPGEDVFCLSQKQGQGLKIIFAPKRDFSHPTSDQILFVQLVNLEKTTLAFEGKRERDWNVWRFTLDSNKKQLSVEALDQSQLRRDIANKVIQGKITEDVDLWDSIRVTAPSQQVRGYLAHRAHFAKAFVLTKISPIH